jgi:hypothetical protein
LINYGVSLINTPYFIIWDIDILLPVDNIKKCLNLMPNFDLIMPYSKGYYQKMVLSVGKNKLLIDSNPHLLKDSDIKIHTRNFGHSHFYKTQSFIKYGKMNEKFRVCAEDQELPYRIDKLGGKVTWIDDGFVYHIEHSRNLCYESFPNLHGSDNYLLQQIKSMTYKQLKEFYKYDLL